MDKVKALLGAASAWADANPHKAIWAVFAIGLVIGWGL